MQLTQYPADSSDRKRSWRRPKHQHPCSHSPPPFASRCPLRRTDEKKGRTFRKRGRDICRRRQPLRSVLSRFSTQQSRPTLGGARASWEPISSRRLLVTMTTQDEWPRAASVEGPRCVSLRWAAPLRWCHRSIYNVPLAGWVWFADVPSPLSLVDPRCASVLDLPSRPLAPSLFQVLPIMFAFSWALLLVLILTAAAGNANPIRLDERQAPNTVSWEYPNSMTAAFNFTTWLLPVSKVDAQKLAGGRTLLAPKDLPAGFHLKKDEHAIMITAVLLSQVRQFNMLAIPRLSNLNLYVPWVQAVASSDVPFSYHVKSFQDQLVPTLLGHLFQDGNAYPGFFDPKHEAYKAIANGFAFNVDVGLLPNDLDGPGLTSPEFQSTFSRSETATLPVKYIRKLMEMPFIRSHSKNTCTKQHYPMKDSFANPFRVKGQVNTGSVLTGKHFTFPKAEGVTGTAQWILGVEGHPCESFV
ncbi:hypothetical protein V8E36_002917 [Tilletia maclaganii]